MNGPRGKDKTWKDSAKLIHSKRSRLIDNNQIISDPVHAKMCTTVRSAANFAFPKSTPHHHHAGISHNAARIQPPPRLPNPTISIPNQPQLLPSRRPPCLPSPLSIPSCFTIPVPSPSFHVIPPPNVQRKLRSSHRSPSHSSPCPTISTLNT